MGRTKGQPDATIRENKDGVPKDAVSEGADQAALVLRWPNMM